MACVSTYLNFVRSTEEAFLYYKKAFGGEFTAPIHRFSDIPPNPGQPPLAESDKNLVVHVEFPILGGHVLMGTDAPESMGFSLTFGNNSHINLEPDTHEERRSDTEVCQADADMIERTKVTHQTRPTVVGTPS